MAIQPKSYSENEIEELIRGGATPDTLTKLIASGLTNTIKSAVSSMLYSDEKVDYPFIQLCFFDPWFVATHYSHIKQEDLDNLAWDHYRKFFQHQIKTPYIEQHNLAMLFLDTDWHAAHNKEVLTIEELKELAYENPSMLVRHWHSELTEPQYAEVLEICLRVRPSVFIGYNNRMEKLTPEHIWTLVRHAPADFYAEAPSRCTIEHLKYIFCKESGIMFSNTNRSSMVGEIGADNFELLMKFALEVAPTILLKFLGKFDFTKEEIRFLVAKCGRDQKVTDYLGTLAAQHPDLGDYLTALCVSCPEKAITIFRERLTPSQLALCRSFVESDQ